MTDLDRAALERAVIYLEARQAARALDPFLPHGLDSDEEFALLSALVHMRELEGEPAPNLTALAGNVLGMLVSKKLLVRKPDDAQDLSRAQGEIVAVLKKHLPPNAFAEPAHD